MKEAGTRRRRDTILGKENKKGKAEIKGKIEHAIFQNTKKTGYLNFSEQREGRNIVKEFRKAIRNEFSFTPWCGGWIFFFKHH